MGACVRKTTVASADAIKRKATLDPLSDANEGDGALTSRVRNLISPMASQAVENRAEEIVGAEELPKEKTQEDWGILRSVLSAHTIFAGLSEEVHRVLIEEMRTVSLAAKSLIFRQDRHGSNFYIIKSGTVSVSVHGEPVRELGSGQSFGELALIQNTKRTATVTAASDVCLWVLERHAFSTAVRATSALHYRETRDFINKVALFDILSFKQKDALLDVVVPMKYNQGEMIAMEGQPGHMMYIVSSGEVQLSVKGELQKTIAKGYVFGEQAIYHPVFTHRATAVAATPVTVLTINRSQALFVLGPQMEMILMRGGVETALASNRTTKKLSSEMKERIIAATEVKHYDAQALVFKRGDRLGSCFYMVLEGNLKTASNLFAQGFDCIGEEEIAMANPTTSIIEDVFAGEETLLGIVTRPQYEAAVNFIPTANNSEALICLRKVTMFKTANLVKLTALVAVLKPQSYAPGTEIVIQGETGSTLFLLRSGSVEIVRDGKVVKTLGKYDFFGERSLVLNEPRGATVRAKSEVAVFMLEQDDWNRVLDERVKQEIVATAKMDAMEIHLSDLRAMSTIEKSINGTTYLVVSAVNGMKFVVTVMGKRALLASGRLAASVDQLQLHKSLDHPLLSKLYRTVKDDRRLYIIREFVAGTSLDRVIYDNGRLSENLVRFYTGNLLLVLEFLHDRGVLHRGLASEHIIVDEKGYPKVCDFENAKKTEGRTNSVVGVPHFMAPEVILGQFYGIGCDLWSLGVLMFEMTQGRVPFGASAQTPIEVYEDILRQKSVRVEGSAALHSIVTTLLDRNPATRCKGGVDALMRAEWFASFPWEEVMMQEATPALIPRSRKLEKDVQRALSKPESFFDFLSREDPDSAADLPASDESAKLWSALDIISLSA